MISEIRVTAAAAASCPECGGDLAGADDAGTRRNAGIHVLETGHAVDLETRIVSRLVPQSPRDPGRAVTALTRRELQIALMVTADGLTNGEIARKLTISRRTVDSHLEHIYTKTQVRSRVQLAAWLMWNCLPEDDRPRAPLTTPIPSGT